MDSRATRVSCSTSLRRLDTCSSRLRRADCSRRSSITSALYCSTEMVLHSCSDVEDGACKVRERWRWFGRSVLVLDGRSAPPGDLAPGASSLPDGDWADDGLRLCRVVGGDGFLCPDGSAGVSLRPDCMRAIAHSRSINFTSKVVSRCSSVTFSSCCNELTSVPTIGGMGSSGGASSSSSSSGPSRKDGSVVGFGALATVVRVGGRSDASASETAPKVVDPAYDSKLRRRH